MSVLPFRQPAANPGRFEELLEEMERDLAPLDVPAAIGRLAAIQTRLLLGELARPQRGAEEQLLSVEEVAKRLNVTPDWLYRQKHLPFAVKVGRLRRYSKAGLNRWIQQRQGRA